MSGKAIKSIKDLELVKANYNKKLGKYKYQILICSGAGCISCGCKDIRDAVVDEISKNKLEKDICVYETGCMGTCAIGPVMMILPERIYYTNLTSDTAREIKKPLPGRQGIDRIYIL